LLAASPSLAAEFTPDELLYFQRIQVVSQMNGSLWKGIERQAIPDPQMAGFARKVNSVHLSQIRAWGAPTQKLASLHDSLQGLLRTMDAFYGAVESSDSEGAMKIGAKVQTEMRELSDAWKAVSQ